MRLTPLDTGEPAPEVNPFLIAFARFQQDGASEWTEVTLAHGGVLNVVESPAAVIAAAAEEIARLRSPDLPTPEHRQVYGAKFADPVLDDLEGYLNAKQRNNARNRLRNALSAAYQAGARASFSKLREIDRMRP